MIQIIMGVIRNKQGNMILAAAFVLGMLMLGFLISYTALITYIKKDINNAIVFACESAVKNTVIDSNNIKTIDTFSANQDFYDILQKNLSLDVNNNPLGTKNSYISGQVRVNVINYYDSNTVTLPYSPPHTSRIYNYPTIHVEVQVPIFLPFFSSIGASTIYPTFIVDVEAEDI